jgi:hypothetical protein
MKCKSPCSSILLTTSQHAWSCMYMLFCHLHPITRRCIFITAATNSCVGGWMGTGEGRKGDWFPGPFCAYTIDESSVMYVYFTLFSVLWFQKKNLHHKQAYCDITVGCIFVYEGLQPNALILNGRCTAHGIQRTYLCKEAKSKPN